ncbi:vWA domain-containing protein [Microlunatus speluncae]|uniref:vWA domain-containing protein n=1 Tax=Microlunatus speluncae TaxID=2594267 RepID=UPI0012664389|nr:VWA domain-containing protein [Microlunatus speluncae]
MSGRRSRIRRFTAAALGGLIMVGLVLGAGTVPAAADGGNGKLLLVLDSSGSMKEKAGDGKTKIEAARAALNRVVDALPSEAQVGMRVYGATVFDRKDEGACEDTQLVVPIGTGNQAKLKAQIAKYKPYGETPIAYSLEQAAKDVGTEGQRTILLVSDGEETCVPDPCPIAEKIAAAGIDLKIDVVGLRVSGKAEKQLRCIADKGNGDYYDADDTEDLERSLSRLTSRAFRPFALSGTPVTGAAEPGEAAELGAGSWLDTLPGEAEAVKYYRLRRSQPGSTFWVGTSLLTQEFTAQLALKLVLPDDLDRTCGYAYPSVVGAQLSRRLLTGMLSSHSDAKLCNDATELLLQVGFTDFSENIAKERYQLRVDEEPPLSSATGLPDTADDPTWKSMAPTKAKPVESGTSFADAPTITAGTYQIDVMPGEIQTFKVSAGWGQRIQVLTQVGKLAKADQWVAAGVRGYGVDLLSPYGGSAGATFAKGGPSAQSSVSVDGNEVGTTTKEIRWANRDGSGDDDHSTARAGDYYVTVRLDRNKADEPAFGLPMTLTVAVLGEAQPAPPYVDAGTPPSTPSSSAPATTPPPSSSASTDPTDPESPQGSPGAGDPPRDDAAGDQPQAGLIAVLIGAAVLLVGGGTGLLVWLRRRP